MSRARDLGGSYTGNQVSKNLVHNGNFLINQRNFSSYELGNLASEPAAIWVADRWRTYGVGPYGIGAKYTMSNVDDAPPGFSRSIRFQSTKIPTSTSGFSGESGILHSIEGRELERSAAGIYNTNGFSISFWVKSSLAGTFMTSIAFQTSLGDTIYNSEYTITQANTWQKIILRLPALPITYTIPFDVNRRIVFKFPMFGYGSFIGAVNNQWIPAPTTPYSKTTNSINLIETLNATINFSGLQIEVGAPTPYEYLSTEQQLSICQRYFYTTTMEKALGASRDAGLFFFTKDFPVPMRTTPSFSHNVSTKTSNGSFPGTVGQIGFYGNGWIATNETALLCASDGSSSDGGSFYIAGYAATPGQVVSLQSSGLTNFYWFADY